MQQQQSTTFNFEQMLKRSLEQTLNTVMRMHHVEMEKLTRELHAPKQEIQVLKQQKQSYKANNKALVKKNSHLMKARSEDQAIIDKLILTLEALPRN